MNFLKKLFKSEPKDITIKAVELNDWLENSSKEVHSQIDDQIKQNLNTIENLKKDLKKKLENLRDEKLMNPDISAREKHIMQGNRENYIQRGYLFVDKIEQPEYDYEKIEYFCTDFEDLLQNFVENSNKSYYILTHFFDKQMKEIAAIIKKIEDSTIKILNLVKDKNVRKIKALFGQIRELNENILENKKLNSKLRELNNDLNNTEIKKSSLDQKLNKLKNSKEYYEFHNIEQQKQETDNKVSKLKFKINNALKNIDKALRKYMHGALNKELISIYLEDPLMAMEQDSELEILRILEKLKKEIKSGHITIKDKLKTKTIKSIDSINKVFLDNIMTELDKLKIQKTKLNNEADKLTIMMDYKELQYQMEHATEKIDRLHNEITDIKSNLNNLQVKERKARIETTLSEFSGDNIKIALPGP